MNKTPTTLIIMDGFGMTHGDSAGNAVRAAKTPRLDQFFQEFAHTELSASGLDVGLPDGQMGNSEVGHTNIGAGRVVFQDLPRITKSIADGDFFTNPAYNHAMDACKEKGTALHLMGLLSDGGVHSHLEHLFALLKLAKDKGLERVYIHAFLDGRDVSPTSGADFVARTVEKCREIGVGKIATVMGRYYAMDRDKRWDRVEQAYDAMVYGESAAFNPVPVAAVKDSYAAGVTDEFVEPVVCDTEGTISDNDSVYKNRLYYGFGKADPSVELVMGPNITDWPRMYALEENVLVELAAVIHDPVTTTDELIPSGETSSYRSNPLRLAEFTLSRRVPEYVGLSKAVAAQEADRRNGVVSGHLQEVLSRVGDAGELVKCTQFGSAVFANKPGDGSAREQAASCQKVLGGFANICYRFATKRYRSNCINWGILPFTLDEDTEFPYESGDCVFVPGVRSAVENGQEDIPAKVIRKDGSVHDLLLHIRGLTEDEKEILLRGCLMNYYAARNKE